MSLPHDHPQLVSIFDRRIEQIETGLDTLTDQMRDHGATLNRMSEALTAVVRLEERLTSSIESSKDQKEALKRVHDRLESQREALDLLLNEVYKRIETERNDCIDRFTPINNSLQRQQGALQLATVVIPTIYSAVLGVGGWFMAGQVAYIDKLQTQVNTVQTVQQVQEERLIQLHKDKR